MVRKDTLSFIITLFFCLGLQAFLAKSVSIWGMDGPQIMDSNPLALFFLFSGLAAVLFLKLSFSPWAFVAWLWLLFLSDWIDRPYNFFQGVNVRGEIILFSLLTLVLARKKMYLVFNYLPVLALIICAFSFLSQSNGRLIFSDDHTVFQFRFENLKGNFPNIPFYYPLWNGGLDARDFFATGSLNVFSIFSPLLYSFPVEKVYNLIVILLLFVFHPVCIYLAAKLDRIPSPGPAIAASLSFALSLSWYRWALQYGTLGFLTSCALIPLNLVFISYLLDDKENLSPKLSAAFVFSFTLMLLWSLSGFAFIPAIILGLLKAPRILRKKNILVIGAFIIALNTPWIISFWKVSNVSKFVTEGGSNHNQANIVINSSNSPEGTLTLSDALKNYYKRSLRMLRENTIPVNPLLFTLGLLGALLYAPRANRLFLLTGIWLTGLCMFISPLLPRLELDRMLVLFSVIFTLPTSKALLELFKDAEYGDKRASIKRVAVSLAGGMLITSVFVAGTIVSNRSLMHYYFENEDVNKVAESIRRHHRGGRVLFSGFVLHELSNGHLATLTYRTGIPLMASSHVHNMWKYKQIIPAYFLKNGDSGVEEYFDLYNVSAIFAHERDWISYFRERKNLYEEFESAGKFKLFRRINYKNTFIISGQGEVIRENSNSITLKPKSRSLTISFNYFPFLTSSACELKSKSYGDNINFIALENCPIDSEVTIKSVPLLKRIMGT